MLETTASGRGSVLLVEGPPGIGKSRLLASAEDVATEHCVTVIRGSADELSHLPLAPPLAALDDVLLLEGNQPPSSDPSAVRPWLEKTAAHLAERATNSTMLITADDLQWSDSLSASALRVLPPRLASFPIAWALARGSGGNTVATDWLFDELEQDGAARVRLGPLPGSAVPDVINDVLGAAPDSSLRTLADGAAGNPRLLVELLAGLLEEDMIDFTQGRARLLATGTTPQRIELIVHRQLDSLSLPARRLLDVAAILCRPFVVPELARLLGEPPARLETPLHEALDSNLLRRTNKEVFAFRCALVRQSVADMIPAAVRWALRRQIADTLPPSCPSVASGPADLPDDGSGTRGTQASCGSAGTNPKHGLPPYSNSETHPPMASDTRSEHQPPRGRTERLIAEEVWANSWSSLTYAPDQELTPSAWLYMCEPLSTASQLDSQDGTADSERSTGLHQYGREHETSDDAAETSSAHKLFTARRNQDNSRAYSSECRRAAGSSPDEVPEGLTSLRSPQASQAGGWATLTDTERAVADLVAEGLTNREAANRVFLSPHTVSFHLRKVFRKLGIRSRVELARLAVQRARDADGRSGHPVPSRRAHNGLVGN